LGGSGGACCRACTRGLPCGTPVAGLGTAKDVGTKPSAPSTSGPPVGADPSLESVANDVKALAQQAYASWGDVTLNRTLYDRLKRQAAAPATSAFRFTAEEAKQFVTGTIVDVSAAYVKGRELAALTAPTSTRRDQLMAAQRDIARAARGMLDAAVSALQGAQPASGSGTSGLGIAPIAVFAIIAVGVAILAAGAAVYAWVQSSNELNAAMIYADRICAETPGGCTPALRAQLVRDLRMPDAVTSGVLEVSRGLGEGLKTTVIVVGVGGAVVLGLWGWLRFSRTGQRLRARMAGRAA
jgi:hypothetical protein